MTLKEKLLNKKTMFSLTKFLKNQAQNRLSKLQTRENKRMQKLEQKHNNTMHHDHGHNHNNDHSESEEILEVKET